MHVKKFFYIFLCFIAAFFVPGCSKNPSGAEYWQYDYYSFMDSAATLKVFGNKDDVESERRFLELAECIKNVLGELDSSLSAEIGTSSVCRFNSAAAGEKVEIDRYTYDVLMTAKKIYGITDGAYNPAVYYSVKAYGFNSDSKPPESAEELPSETEINIYTDLSSHFDELELINEGDNYYAVKPLYSVSLNGEELSLKIDLGGIGKGYAVDKVNVLLDEYSFEYGYFNFGLSSIAFKQYPDESLSFNLKCENPRSENFGGAYFQNYFTTDIKNECVSTSADNLNYFMLDADGDGVAERYSHIFDPRTGRPVKTGIISVTIIGGTAAENDALTTAIMAMGRDRAVEFIVSRLADRRVAFAYESGDKLYMYTNMEKSRFTLDDTNYNLVLLPGGGADVA